MFSALIYLQYHTVRNRLVMRFKRLRQPKYMAGAIVGGIYFYFYFYRYLFMGRGRGNPYSPSATPGDPAFYESLGALILGVVVLLGWLLPRERAALAFTEAEVAFLFPAPVTRRGLIQFKLLRSQTAILFTTLILTLFSNRGGGRGWYHVAGWWLILSTFNLHMLGSSFARTMLLEKGISNWKRRTIILALVAILAAVVFVWAERTIPAFDPSQFKDADNPTEMMSRGSDYFKRVMTSGPLPYLLYPFRLVIRPYMARSVAAFLQACLPVFVILALHYWWVVRADVAFEEASVDASKKLADRIAAARAGRFQQTGKKAKAKRPPFTLAPTGPRVMALLWKNLINAGQAFTVRFWILLAVVGLSMSVGMGQAFRASGIIPALGMIAATLLGMSFLLGPQLMRQDFRQDLPLADLLKMYPLRGWQVALGEVLAPVTILTAVQWFLLIVAVGLFSQANQFLPVPRLLSIGLSAGLIAPMLNLISLQIPNAALLLFPSWFQSGKDAPQGIEATGQRLIAALGQLLAWIIALVPAVLVFGLIFFATRLVTHSIWLSLPVASLGATLALAAEAAASLRLLGWLFERLDLSAESGPS